MASPISELMPTPRHREVFRVEVGTDPIESWDLVRSFDLYSLRYVHALFRLRGAGAATATLDDIVAPGTGFHCLAEVPGKCFVAGAVGKFWKRHIPFVDVTAETFKTFAEPGYGRVVWSIEVAPRGIGGSWITLDLRVDATSEDAWSSFIPYWIAIGRFSRSIRHAVLHHFEKVLGHPPPDELRTLPGDMVLPIAQLAHTDAITIDAPVEEVWPLLSRVDHLAILERDPPRSLVLGSPNLLPESGLAPASGSLGVSYDVTWSFFLEPIGDATRLIVRVRAAFEPTLRSELLGPVVSAIHALRESSQLRHVKERAEAGLQHHAA